MLRKEGIDRTASISRDKYTKAASLHINTPQPWDIYVGSSVDLIDLAHPILSGSGEGNFLLPVDLSNRSYFKLVSGLEEVVLAERLLPMEGAFNFRDLGGILMKDGRRVQWGKLFRADELTNLTASDIKYLEGISIKSVIDFRAENEIKRAPDKLPPTAEYTYPLTIAPGAMSPDRGHTDEGKASFAAQMRQMNESYVTDPACIRAYRIMFAIIQNSLSAPLVFHCSAGKDRTGMAAALILFALGASEESVMADYMLSKFNIADKYKLFVEKYPRTEPIFTVKRSYLMSGIEKMKQEYGSVMNFLTKVLKVDVVKMRQLYLEPLRR